MGNLASSQLTTQSDPALVQRQILADREKQLASISNPQQQLAARLGGLLGGGIVNVANDRGFFDVSDPLLTKVTQIQGIYNEVASRVDPTADPARFYSELQSAYSNAGLGREALAAAQEAQKAKGSALDLQLKETQALEKNPELIAGKIESALKAGDEAEAMRLANLSSRLQEDRELALEGKRTNILKDKAYIAYQNKLAADGKFTYKPVDPMNPLAGDWKIDQRGKREYVPFPDDVAAKITAPGKANDSKGSPKLSQEQVNALVNPTSTVSNAPQSTVLSQEGANRLLRNQPQAQPTPVNWATRLQELNNILPTNLSAQERDFAIQRAYPTIPVSTLPEEAKAQLAQQLGL